MAVTTNESVGRGALDPSGHEFATTKPNDGLVSFSVMWALALIFSVVSHLSDLMIVNGWGIGIIEWAVLGASVAVMLQPRSTATLFLLAALMAVQYFSRLPVASNNQTIAFFMNLAIVAVIAVEVAKGRSADEMREDAYERLRVVARALLATMYFYGIFHKINVDFLDPEISCAVALYKPIVQHLGLADNIYGRYAAIGATFVVETITIISLYWRRYFAVGLIIGLVFHYIIPISAYSWYMDFSSLVFALYILSVPREVSASFYARGTALFSRIRLWSGAPLLVTLIVVLVMNAVIVGVLGWANPDRSGKMLWHSVWLLTWAVIGGVVLVMLVQSALETLPYSPAKGQRQPAWLYAFPAILFLSCMSPYLGLKTESSIAMFSNLHTEGGETNHLVLRKPMYFFDYQREVATIEASSERSMQALADRRLAVVRYTLEEWLRANPHQWVTFTMDGVRRERATATTFPPAERTMLERYFLIFKPVDYARPKVCSH